MLVFKRLGGFADPVMDISVITGMDKPQRIQEWPDFMFWFISLFIYHIERGLVLQTVLVGKCHCKTPVQSCISLRLTCVLLWFQILFAS